MDLIRNGEEAALDPHERAAVRTLEAIAWPGVSGDLDDPLHDPALSPEIFLAERFDDSARPLVVGALAVLSTELHHAGRWRAAGLSAVVVHPSARGCGVGTALVEAATAWMAPRFDVGLFTCDRPLAPFYEHAGWQVLPGAVLVGGTRDDPLPSDADGFDKVVLATFFTDEARAAAAAFADRIPLYPGARDRLW